MRQKRSTTRAMQPHCLHRTRDANTIRRRIFFRSGNALPAQFRNVYHVA
jgi:hypothetical protein